MIGKKKLIKGKIILITGGTGSFGKYITKELLKHNPKEIRIFSRDEDKQYSMQYDFKNFENLRFIIGDVRDLDSVAKATKGVDIVLHAAALKQIPSTEYNVIQAVKTNVLGAQNVVDASIENRVGKVLAISTDKAVEPINVMGMTKGIQERIFTLGNKYVDKKTVLACVRYGNVVASRGSVIPLFLKQIESEGSLTITNRTMTRFILTLQNAIELVFTALSEMKGGEVFVPNVKSIKIIDLAEFLLSELNPKNKRIAEIGIRPGEKIHETLISVAESLRTVKKNGYLIILPNIDLGKIGYAYKTLLIDKSKGFVYSSNQGPFMTKEEIKKMLQKEGII